MLLGPSPMFGLPRKLFLILIGLFVLGFIQAMTFIPALPEAIEVYQQKFRIVEGYDVELDNKLSDCISSLYSFLYNLAALFGPVIGGMMYDVFGYEHTMDVNLILQLIFAVVFYWFNCGRDVFQRDAKLKSELKRLKAIGDEQ